MGRKIFISTLGTNNYSKLSYYTNDFKSEPVRFIQIAELNRLKVKETWTNLDKVIVLLTDEARKRNWLDDGQVDRESRIIKQKGLESQIKSLGLPCELEDVSIKDGNTTEEIWDIFYTVYEKLEEGDELYFDITHGFRYLPMLILVLGNYSRFLKDTRIKSITYGNFEARSKDEGPIVDLLPFVSLQEWTSASASFLQTGHVEELTRLSKVEIGNSFKKEDIDKANITSQSKFTQNISNIVNRLIACRGIEIKEGIDFASMNSSYDMIKDPVLKPMESIFNKLHESMSGFKGDSVYNNFTASKWCFERKLYQQAYTYLEEGITSLFCVRNGLDWKDKFERSRILGAAHGYLGSKNTNKYFKRDPNSYIDKEYKSEDKKVSNADLIICKNSVNVQLCMLDEDFKKSYNLIESIKDIRNDYNHAGYREDFMNSEKFSKTDKFFKYIEQVENIESEIKIDKSKTYFINFSNHPISEWSEKQLEMAKEYGSIIDMPFPNIDSDGKSDDIDDLVKSYQEIFKTIEGRANIIVHIMGEQTFSFRTIVELKSRGVKCLASTTERVCEEEDGIKTSVFEFKNYREY